MDSKQVGELIRNLRIEKKMTQNQLAEKLNVSDKAISKWERGLGCPDISLLNDLSNVLNTNIENILSGDLKLLAAQSGNIERTKFFVCLNCNNILFSNGEADIACCGRKLMPLVSQNIDEIHNLSFQTVEDDYYIVFNHEMSKEHYINFAAYVAFDKVLLMKLYPQQGAEIRFPIMTGGAFYFGCTKHGLYKLNITS